MTIADKPHGRSRYNAGCRCGTCKKAQREYQRSRRSKHLRPVPAPPPEAATDEPRAAGPVAQAVALQLENLDAARERPALAAIALTLAEGIDRDDALPQRAALAHRLSELLDVLSKSSKRRGKLAAVRSLTDPRR